MPTVPSPLAREESSFETWTPRNRSRAGSITPPEIREEEDEVGAAGPGSDAPERNMTPTIPEWILTPGSLGSMTIHESRKSHLGEDFDSGEEY
jgi:hypothetical protein